MSDSMQFVAKEYTMDPEVEDLLPNGKRLRDGMQVLVENNDYRSDLATIEKSPNKLDNALRYNRWCIVTEVEIIGNDSQVSFVACYEDGTKRKLIVPIWRAWYVKIDSIPHVDPTVEEAWEEAAKVFKLLWGETKVAFSEAFRSGVDGAEETPDDSHAKGVPDDVLFSYGNVELLLILNDQKLSLTEIEQRMFLPEWQVIELLQHVARRPIEQLTRRQRSMKLSGIFDEFVAKNLGFFRSKDVHSLNEILSAFLYYLGESASDSQLGITRDEVAQLAKKYFETYAYTNADGKKDTVFSVYKGIIKGEIE